MLDPSRILGWVIRGVEREVPGLAPATPRCGGATVPCASWSIGPLRLVVEVDPSYEDYLLAFKVTDTRHPAGTSTRVVAVEEFLDLLKAARPPLKMVKG